MYKPKVSVIIPIYNVEKYLARCMDSLLNQTLEDIEIIMVDDGSTDNSPMMCDEYEKKDKRVKVVHKKNNGLGMARNSGLEIANGQYVAFIDSDDFIDRNAFKEMYEVAKLYEADMCMAGYYQFNTKDGTSNKIELFKETKVFNADEVKSISYKMVGAPPEAISDEYFGMSVWKNLYSLDLLKKTNMLFCSEREFVSEDAIFHLSLVPKMNTIVTLNNCYYYYCNNNDVSLSSTFRDGKFDEYKKLYMKEIELLSKYNILEDGKFYIARMFLGNIRNHMKQLSCSGYSVKKRLDIVKTITNDPLLQEVLSWYPYNKNPRAQRLFSTVLKKKILFLIIVFAKLQAVRK